MMKKLTLIALGALLAVGCATGGSVRHKAVIGVVTGHAALSFAQDTEMSLVCGKPSAPAPPACVDAAKHKEISEALVLAFDLDGRVAKTVKSLPDGASQPADVTAMLSQIEDLLKLVLSKIPASPKKDSLVRDLGVQP